MTKKSEPKKPTAQNGKGSRSRISDKSKFDDGFNQINWASNKRRGGRAGAVIKDKTKYDRKKGWSDE